MKQKIMTVAISVVTTLLTLAGAVCWLIYHPIPLPTTKDKDGTIVRSQLRLDRGLVHSTISHKNASIPLQRDYYLFDPEHTLVFDNDRDHTHHRLTVITHPLHGYGVEVSNTYNPDQAASDTPLFSSIVTNRGSSNESRKFFGDTGAEITAEQYKTLTKQ